MDVRLFPGNELSVDVRPSGQVRIRLSRRKGLSSSLRLGEYDARMSTEHLGEKHILIPGCSYTSSRELRRYLT